VTVGEQRRDDVDHLGNMLGRPRHDLRPLVAKRVKILEKILRIRLSEFVNADIPRRRLVDDPVVDIGQVHHVRQLVALELQIPPQNVAKNESPKIADMGKIPDRRPADVHADLARFERLKFLDLSRKCVIEMEPHQR